MRRQFSSTVAVASAAALLMTIGVAGCGSGSSGPVAVRVGDASIGAATVHHWAKSADKEVASSLGESHGTARERALSFLISANWLIGEAANQGVAVSNAAVERHLRERIGAVPNGKAEFEDELHSSGQTTDDVKLQIEAELAAAALRELVSRRVQPVTQEEIAAYYARNRAHFHIPDLRITDLVEGIHGSRASAVALGERLGTGKRFKQRGLHEEVARQTPAEDLHRDNAELVRTIFHATPGVIAPPVWFNHAWVLVVVRKMIPGRFKPLSAVKEEIAARLSTEHHRVALVDFLKAYRNKWVAKTDCKPGFVVQKCAQYHGPTVVEGNPLVPGSS